MTLTIADTIKWCSVVSFKPIKAQFKLTDAVATLIKPLHTFSYTAISKAPSFSAAALSSIYINGNLKPSALVVHEGMLRPPLQRNCGCLDESDVGCTMAGLAIVTGDCSLHR